MKGRFPHNRSVALLSLFVFCAVFVFPKPIRAQPFTRYQDESKKRIGEVIDRAAHLTTEQDWSNYVALGVAAERARWEEDALDSLAERFEQIDRQYTGQEERDREKARARSQYEAAAVSWEAEAEDQFFADRGRFRARTALGEEIERISEEEYRAALALAEAETTGLGALELELWDDTIAESLAPHAARRTGDLQTRIAAARSSASAAGLGAEEARSFEVELQRLEGELRQDFLVEDSFQLKRARNRYILAYTASTDDGRLEAESDSAAVISQRIINGTFAELQKETEDMLGRAVADMQDLVTRAGPNVVDVDGAEWDRRVQAIIDAGLRRWNLAEEDLYTRRLEWMREAKRSRAEADRVWRENHEALQREMARWVKSVEDQAREGRRAWADRHAALAASRDRAELELTAYAEERTRSRTEAANQLRELVSGGGSSLLEAKEARSYYQEMPNQRGWSPACSLNDSTDLALCRFYVSEGARLGDSILAFQRILLGTNSVPGSEDILREMLHGTGAEGGLLVDRRLYAGDLPDRIAELDEDDFETSLRDLMEGAGEEFVLYRRDMISLMDGNRFFSERARELVSSPAWNIGGAASASELEADIRGFNARFSEQREELLGIVRRARPNTIDEAQRLAAIRAEIQAWQERVDLPDARLKAEVLRYFRMGAAVAGDGTRPDGQTGLHETGNENDPYLLTQAEYEWELLRRERNALAARYERAQEVKRYADLAVQHEAGLELAEITRERAEVAERRALLLQLSYELTKGDVELNADVYSVDPATRDGAVNAELTRLLESRGLGPEVMERARVRLADEKDILNELAGLSAIDAAAIAALRTRISTFLETHVNGADQAETTRLRGRHRLSVINSKLAGLAGEVSVLTPEVLANRLTALTGAARFLSTEAANLAADYDFAGYTGILAGLPDLIRARTAEQLQGDLTGQRLLIAENAGALNRARLAMDAARDSYRQAYLDLHILTSGNGAELIEKELAEATGALSSVLHRMVKMEAIPGFAETVGDVLTAARAEYLQEVSAGERAAYDALRAEELLVYVEGLDAAKGRERNLTALLAADNTGALSVEDLARLLLSKETELSVRTAADARGQSDPEALSGFDTLRSMLATLASARAELAALAAADPPPENAQSRRADLQGQLLLADATLRLSSERIAGAIRGETMARASVLQSLLGSKKPDGSSAFDTLVFADQTNSQTRLVEEGSYDLAARAATRISEFLIAEQGRNFAELVSLVTSRISALDVSPSVKMSAVSFGAQALADPGEVGEWRMVLRWLLANRAQIEYVGRAPDASDVRPTAERWQALLSVVRDLSEDSSFHRAFQREIPTSVNASWVADFLAQRTRLRDEVSRILLLPAGEQAAEYAALGPSDRQVLETYGRPDSLKLDDSLRGFRSHLSADIAAVPYRFRELFLREAELSAGRELRAVEGQLQPKRAEADRLTYRAAELKTQRAELESLRLAAADPGERANLQARIAALEGELGAVETALTTLQPIVDALSAVRRSAGNRVAEARQPGSTSSLYALALSELLPDVGRLERSRRVLAGVDEARRTSQALNTSPSPEAGLPSEALLGALGWAVVDGAGQVLRENGRAVLTAEGLTLARDGVISLSTVLGSPRTGPELAQWTGRLQSWLGVHQGSTDVPAEVRAAIELLEASLREYQNARLFIDVTRQGTSAAQLALDGAARRAEAEARLEDLSKLLELEGALQRGIEGALASGGSTLAAGLAALQQPNSIALLRRLLESTGGSEPGSAGEQLTERARELIVLSERLREARESDTLSLAVVQFSATQALIGVGNYRGTPRALAQFRSAHAELEAASFLGRVRSLADGGTRAALMELLRNARPEEALFSGALAGVLLSGPADGVPLREAAAAAIESLSARIVTELAEAAEGTEAGLALLLDASFQADGSLEAMIADFARSKDQAQTALLPTLVALSTLPEGTSGDEVARAVREAVEEALGRAGFALLRGQMLGVLEGESERLAEADVFAEAQADPVERARLHSEALLAFRTRIQSAMSAYVGAMEEPTAAELSELRESLYRRDVSDAALSVGGSDSFPTDSVPSELRELFLLREFSRARERQATYNADRMDPARAASAALDLSGLGGEYARWLVVQELEQFSLARPTGGFVTSGPPGSLRGASEYLSEFFLAHPVRGLSGAVLGLIQGRVLAAELARLESAAGASGGIHTLDPAAFLSDFRAMILAAKVLHHAELTNVTIAGDTVDEREASYGVSFAGLLASADSGGRILGLQFAGTADRESLFRLAFSVLESGIKTEDLLPVALRNMAAGGQDPRAPLPDAEALLPPALRAIVAYAGADYHACARALGPDVEAALLTTELAEYTNLHEDLSALLSDEQLEGIIERGTGRSALPEPVRLELLTFLRAANEHTALGAPATLEEAVRALRDRKVQASVFTDTDSEREAGIFLAAHAPLVDEIEQVFFAALKDSPAGLRTRAKENRGLFLNALIRHAAITGGAPGPETDYYVSTINAPEQASLNELILRLFGDPGASAFSESARTLLLEQGEMVGAIFQYRSGRELIESGLFENIESSVFGRLTRSGDTTLLVQARANRPAVLRDFLALVAHLDRGAAADTFVGTSGVPGLDVALAEAVRDMRPDLRRTIAVEQTLIDRFATDFLETTTERERLVALLTDPAAWNPGARRDSDSATRDRALLELELEDLAAAVTTTATDHARLLAQTKTDLEREQGLGTALERFARERGSDDLNFTESRFVDARTFIGSEQSSQVRSYRSYVDGLLAEARFEAGGVPSQRVSDLVAFLGTIQAADSPADWPTGRPSGVMSFAEHVGLGTLFADDLGLDPTALITGGRFDAVLQSDNLQATAGMQSFAGAAGDPSDDVTAQLRPVQVVQTIDVLTATGTPEEKARRVYFANLANRYLGALTGLSEALSAVARATALADARLSVANNATAQEQDLISRFRAAADPGSPDATAARALLDTARSEKAAHGQEQVRSKFSKLAQAAGAKEQAHDKFANAGRRRFLFGQNAKQFIERTFQRIAGEQAEAQTAYNNLAADSAALRTRYAQINTDYIASLNKTSAAYRSTLAATQTAERLRSVADYASTPYLFATTGSRPGEITADADSEYNRARTALSDAEERLTQAAYGVLVQTQVEDFTRISDIFYGNDPAAKAALAAVLSDEESKVLGDLRDRRLKQGLALTATEQAQLEALADRALFAEHRRLIETRGDYVKHALRMVRVTKAKEILAAEIQRREAVVTAREQEYRSALSAYFPLQAGKDSQENRTAQLATYRRLAGIVDAGGDLYREYCGWYYGTGPWLAAMGQETAGHWISTGQLSQPQIFWPTIAEVALGQIDAGGIPPGDMEQIARYQQVSGSGWEGYRDFESAYQPYLLSTGQYGAQEAALVITTATMSVVSAVGTGLLAGGASMIGVGTYYVASGLALIATVVGAPAGTSMLYTGYGMIAGGVAMVGAGMAAIATATTAIAAATVNYLLAAWTTIAALDNAQRTAFNATHTNQIKEIQSKERRYQEALAALNYFKKAPDQKTVKERIIQWGAAHSDPDGTGNNLYRITEDDLAYLFDRNTDGSADYRKSDGTSLNPTDEVRADSLDIGNLRNSSDSRDSSGNRYDANPAHLLSAPPGELRAGYYHAAEARYTAIQILNHNGSFETRYARIIEQESAESATQDRTFDIGALLSATVNHGNDLLAARRNGYFDEGAGGSDDGFTLRERESTLGLVLAEAGGRLNGGVEYGGYRTAFDEYLENANAIGNAETTQRVSLQRADWALRAAELREREAEWERRFEAIMSRGRKSWAGALNRFRLEWTQWEKDFDRKVAEGDRQYADRIVEHFSAKQKWEADTKAALEERSVTDALTGVIGNLNTQITALNANAHLALEKLNTLEVIQKQIAEIRKDIPGSTERLQELNKNIAAFQTQLGLSELSHMDSGSGLASVASNYAATLKDHQRDMTRLAKAKAVEQFQDLLGKLKEQIERQNRAIDQQTANAAAGAGFMRQGDKYVKVGTTASAFGIVDAYKSLDADSEISRRMAESGFALKTGKDLTDYLTDDSTSEAEATAFFETQRYALQVVFDKIMGTGSASERETSKDEKTLGTFGRWAGRAPDSRSAGTLAQYSNLTAAGAAALPHAGDLAGFGELGAFGARPSGTAFGFYVQLQFMGQHVSEAGARTAQVNIDPFSAGMGSVLPVAGIASSYLNMQLATQVHGQGGGKAHTQFTNQAGRATLKAGGMLAAGLGTGGIASAGMGGIIAGNLLQDNGHLQLTDRGVVGIGSASLALMGLGAGANVISGGYRFNDHGRATGDWSLSGSRGDAVAAGILGGAFGGAVGAELGGGFGETIFGQGLGAGMSAYGQKQTGSESAWQALLSQDIEVSIAGAGGVLQNAISARAGGPQSGGFLGNLMSGVVKPIGDLWSIGSTVVGAAWSAATAVLMAPVSAVMGAMGILSEMQADAAVQAQARELLGDQAYNKAMEDLTREGRSSNEARQILAGAVLTARRQEEEFNAYEGGTEHGIDPGNSVGEAGNRAWAVVQAKLGNAGGKRDEVTRKIEGFVREGMDLRSATEAAIRSYNVDLAAVDPAKVVSAYSALMREVGVRAAEQAANDSRAAMELHLQSQQAVVAAKSPAYAAILKNPYDTAAVRRLADDGNLSVLEKRAILSSVKQRWVADGSYGRVPVDIDGLMPLDPTSPRTYSRTDLVRGAFNEALDSFFNESVFASADKMKLSNMQLSDGDKAWLQAMGPYAAPAVIAMAGIAIVAGRGKSNTATIGAAGERFAMSYLQQKGYTDIIQIQNKSGHGIDIIARNARGAVRFFEVKSSSASLLGRLSPAQKNIGTFVNSRLDLAKEAFGRWQNVDPVVRASARQIWTQVQQGGQVQGMVIRVQNALTNPSLIGVTRWTAPR